MPSSNEHIIFFKGADWDKGLSLEELQNTMDRFMAWMEKLRQEGKYKVGQPLAKSGKLVTGRKDRIVSDGPFAESKEAVGGYFLLDVEDFDEAVEIAKACPLIDHGVTVEVRPVAEQCPIMARLGMRFAHAVS
jgi:hypothetical protein